MFSNLTLSAQNKTGGVRLNTEGLSFDSVNSIVYDKEILLHQKYKVANSITNNQPYGELVPIFQTVLSEARKQQNDSIQMQMYNRLVAVNLVHEKFDQAKTYLDSAFLFEKKVDNPRFLLPLYDYTALYYAYINKRYESHEYFYKAIECCEKIGGMEGRIISTLYNLSLIYASEGDLETLRKNVDKMVTAEPKANTPFATFLTNDIRSEYYLCKYDQENYDGEVEKESLLDSIRLYSINVINLYNSTEKKSRKIHGTEEWL